MWRNSGNRNKNKNPKDRGGCTPLHNAARNGHLTVCQLIIENVRDKDPKYFGWTPIQIATHYGLKNVKKFLESAIGI